MMREKVWPVAWLMLAAIIIGASIGLSARANATPAENDDTYLSTLSDLGVDYANTDAMVEAGHTICNLFGEGLTALSVINAVADAGWPATDAAYMTGAAVGSYCNEYGYLFDRPATSATYQLGAQI